jgi:DNA-directed RNA polymerase specialized sigma24 family protein
MWFGPKKGAYAEPGRIIYELVTKNGTLLTLRANGHSTREIAEILGIGDGTVRDRLKDQRGKPRTKFCS